jgi:hypothetical protein
VIRLGFKDQWPDHSVRAIPLKAAPRRKRGGGSVHFLSYSADSILPSRVTRAGNEAAELL